MAKYVTIPMFNWKFFSLLKYCLKKQIAYGTVYKITQLKQNIIKLSPI